MLRHAAAIAGDADADGKVMPLGDDSSATGKRSPLRVRRGSTKDTERLPTGLCAEAEAFAPLPVTVYGIVCDTNPAYVV